jgi:hypothetical protein
MSLMAQSVALLSTLHVPTGETPDELVAHMALMLESLQQPFLLEGDFIPEGDGELEFTFIREDEKKYH